jgi:energy-converting hydrogenase B subunit K
MFLSTEKCNNSGECVDACPTDAIRIVDGKAFSCITCGKCMEVCPNNAIFKTKYGGYVVDRAKCNLCGMCMVNCPVDNITVKDGKIMGICSRCGVCVDACPNDARVDASKIEDEKQIATLESLNAKIPVDDEEPPKKKMTNRLNIGTVHEDCIKCGRCAYFCPSNAIKFSYIEPGVCTKCDSCIDVCPRDAIGPKEEGGEYFIDMGKCAVCYKCLIECPNDAITTEHQVLEIHHPEYDVENDTAMIACLSCGLCAEACPTNGLSVISKRIRYDVDYCSLANNVNGDEHCAKDFDHAPCVNACPQGILQFVPDSKITLEGICVSCGGCVDACKYDARKFGNTMWKGEVGVQCIKCGICVEVCPNDALSIKDGQVKLNFDKCVLCEKCAMHCPVNALPKTTPLKMKIANGYSMINNKLCIDCGLCYEKACIFHAISKKENGDLTINNKACIYCGACKTICPANAIKIQRDFEASI